MNKGLIQCIFFAALGFVLAANGVTFLTWGFWAVMLLGMAIRFVGDE